MSTPGAQPVPGELPPAAPAPAPAGQAPTGPAPAGPAPAGRDDHARADPSQDRHGAAGRPPAAGFRKLYGAGPLHLMALLLAFALALYTVSLIADDPAVVKIGIWFVGAALVWDLVLGPLLALVDRGLLPLRRIGALNHVRIPLLASALLLLVWAPVILQRSEGVFRTKAGLGQDPFLGRWLAITGVLFAVSALLWVLSRLRGRGARSEATPSPGRRRAAV